MESAPTPDEIRRIIRSGPVPIIHGPTASGKTALAHALCDMVLGVGCSVTIVNADAFQFYKGFSVGTAKPTADELARYQYAFVDNLETHENADANLFGQEARALIKAKRDQGVFVVVVGGSGLYCRSLLHGLDELPARNDEIRGFLREVARIQGRPVLHTWLSRIDPKRAAKLHPSDLVRNERALEIFLESGQIPSSLATKPLAPRDQTRLLNAKVINICIDTAELAERIGRRTAILLRGAAQPPFGAGEGPWVAEVRELLAHFGQEFEALPAARAIGYREIAAACRRSAELSERALGDLLNQITVKTTQYAKRQRTWLGSAASDVELRESEAVLGYGRTFFQN